MIIVIKKLKLIIRRAEKAFHDGFFFASEKLCGNITRRMKFLCAPACDKMINRLHFFSIMSNFLFFKSHTKFSSHMLMMIMKLDAGSTIEQEKSHRV